jgi:hypothetical protein
MLQFHRLSSLWQEDFQSFNQSEHISGSGSHVGFPICTKIANLVEDLPMNKFGPNLFSGCREEDENMKSLQTRATTTTDAKWWQKLTWSFGTGELKKGALDSQPQVYQLLAQGRLFSPGTPASSTTKTGRHDIAEILLKVALNTKNLISNYYCSRP